MLFKVQGITSKTKNTTMSYQFEIQQKNRRT